MSFENLRAKWIKSEERAAIERSIESALTEVLKRAMPLIPRVVIESCVHAAMVKIDAMMTAPPQVVADKIEVRDRR